MEDNRVYLQTTTIQIRRFDKSYSEELAGFIYGHYLPELWTIREFGLEHPDDESEEAKQCMTIARKYVELICESQRPDSSVVAIEEASGKLVGFCLTAIEITSRGDKYIKNDRKFR